jgi:hypothetical protein
MRYDQIFINLVSCDILLSKGHVSDTDVENAEYNTPNSNKMIQLIQTLVSSIQEDDSERITVNKLKSKIDSIL